MLNSNLKLVSGEPIVIYSLGLLNTDSGPDFFNAKIKIGEQLWAGNVELHVKSSDWFLHGHEQDNAYDSVILHVVWEHDTDVFRSDNSILATLALKHFVAPDLLIKYRKLFKAKQKWINCETNFYTVNTFVISNWMERLYFERLERKAKQIQVLLHETNNDWEAVCFAMLAKNFGLKVNGDAFYSLAKSVDFSIIRKTQSDIVQLEALFFGQAGFLTESVENSYYKMLVNEYGFLKQKFSLKRESVLPIKFFRLRPANFPTIRLSQLAQLYVLHKNLFSKIIEVNTLNNFYKLFNIKATEFWTSHYTFSKVSPVSVKSLSRSFIDLLLINTIIPLKFSYASARDNDVSASILKLIQSIKPENNSIVTAFNYLKPVAKTAMDSQALLELKTQYCNKNRCLQCAVGNALLTG